MHPHGTDVDLSIVVPLYNERESIAELYDETVRALTPLGRTFEFLFADDGSTDGSFDEIAHLHAADPRVRAVRFRTNHGKSPALAEAFRRVRGRVVVTIDADLQDDPAEIPAMLRLLDGGLDLVCAWRTTRRDRFVKRVTSKLFNAVTVWVTGVGIHDFNCGLKVYRREVVDALRIYGQMHRYIPALAANQGFLVGEHPVEHRERRHGTTKFGPSRFGAGLFDLGTSAFLHRFSRRPLHFFGTTGLAFLALGTLICGWLAYERLFEGAFLKDRPLLLLGVLLIIVAFQFVAIGLLGEMLVESRKETIRYPVQRELE